MKKILWALAALLAFAYSAYAQTLPAGYIGVVSNNTPNTWQTFSYTFTPTQTGANFVGFAFRQDPAFWTFDNVRLTAAGSSTNLLTNGNFNTGGAFTVTTNNGPSSIQAPTSWGVWYQNGTYPAAAGTWWDIGGTNGGVWYDGAVGSFDGIYQGVVLQAGTTYTITFDVSGNNTSNGSGVQLGVYGGACDNASIAASQCTIPSSVGFTTLATPEQGAAAGGPATPTLVSEVNAASTTTTTTTYGAASTVTQVVDSRTNGRVSFTITRTSTPVTSRSFTTTVTTTPHTLQTYSDGSTVTTDGTPTTTTTNGVTLTTGQSTSASKTVSATSTRDSIRAKNMNLLLIDPLSTVDGTWATPYAGYISSVGNYRMTGAQFGWQKTVDNNSFGLAFSVANGKSGNQPYSATESDSYSGTAYLLSKQNVAWFKVALGYSNTEHRTSTAIPEFALQNGSKVRQNNYYADLGAYTPTTFYGIRGVSGVLVNYSTLRGTESGSPLLSTLPEDGGKTKASPYIGGRYELGKASLETRVYTNTDYKNVVSTRGSVNQPIMGNVFLNATVGHDRSLTEKYNNSYGMIGLKVAF